MIKKIPNCTQMIFLLALLVGLSLASSGCGARIVVNQAEPVENTLDAQTIQVNNCNNETEKVAVLEIQQNYKIDDYAITGANERRVVILPEKMAELEAQLEMVYAQVYDATLTSIGHVEMTAPSDMIRAYTIEWTEQVYSSTIIFREGFKKYTTTYTYELRIPKEEAFTDFICYP